MTHLVIATHAHLADALRDAAGMLLGDVQGVSAVNFVPGQTVAELIAQYTQIVEDTPTRRFCSSSTCSGAARTTPPCSSSPGEPGSTWSPG